MSGPIVRSGPSPEFSKNWDNVFGKSAASGKSATSKKSAKKAAAKKKPVKKKAKKSSK